MAMIDINWRPSPKELRVFAVLWLVFFALLGVWFYSRGATATVFGTLWAVAGGGGLLGLALPTAMRPAYVIWMGLAFPIGWLVSHLLLAALFFGLILPTGLLLKVFGYDALHRKLDPEAGTYWTARRQPDSAKRYFSQF